MIAACALTRLSQVSVTAVIKRTAVCCNDVLKVAGSVGCCRRKKVVMAGKIRTMNKTKTAVPNSGQPHQKPHSDQERTANRAINSRQPAGKSHSSQPHACARAKVRCKRNNCARACTNSSFCAATLVMPCRLLPTTLSRGRQPFEAQVLTRIIWDMCALPASSLHCPRSPLRMWGCAVRKTVCGRRYAR